MKKIWERYDSQYEGERRRTQASEVLNKLHYLHEHTFSFDKYITVLQSNFQVLERLYVTLYKEDNLTCLINNISVNNARFKTTISIARKKCNTFNEASTYLSTESCSIFTKTSSDIQWTSIYALNGGRDCGCRHGGGRLEAAEE